MRNVYSDKSNNIIFKNRFIHIYMIDGVIFSCFGIFVILTWPLVKAVPALFVYFYGFFSICHGV
ncbi:hypothetical protein C6A37_00875 [Desulfobacteraceae bacterium SEEP-SAG9]|nr:hypothetical protein C6A37_00875 [Desulfobacteraceae bacterium SEEP-SAG9]